MGSRRVLILSRAGGGINFFTPLSSREFVEALDINEVAGLFGTYPDMKQIEQVKGQLYVLGEEGCRILLGEKTFYLRFGLSLLVFLALFYLLSYVVPDPIPLVDELGLSLGAAILFSLWYRRRVERGDRMVQRRIDVKGSIDRIEFHESPLLKEMELYLETLEQRSLESIGEHWDREGLAFSVDDETGMTAEILKGIEQKLGRKFLSRIGRIVKRSKGKRESWVSLTKTDGDLTLALFYVKCRESLGF
ncbi:MAG: hypothetical protein PQJ60_07090 [Spirochaetales bacterium]|nr:hypothetical protein [Spirochaetales bacterium]